MRLFCILERGNIKVIFVESEKYSRLIYEDFRFLEYFGFLGYFL